MSHRCLIRTYRYTYNRFSVQCLGYFRSPHRLALDSYFEYRRISVTHFRAYHDKVIGVDYASGDCAHVDSNIKAHKSFLCTFFLNK